MRTEPTSLKEFKARWQKRGNDFAQFSASVDGQTLIDRMIEDLEAVIKEVQPRSDDGSSGIAEATGSQLMLMTRDAASYLGLAPQTLAKMRLSGDSPPFYKLGRRVLYKRTELDLWVSRRRRKSTSDTGGE